MIRKISTGNIRVIRHLLLGGALILIVILTMKSVLTYTANEADVRIGHEVPDFTLTTMDGKEIQLSDFRGSGVLLNFWASWCNHCVNELPLMNEASKKMHGVEVVAVNVGEDAAIVERFAERYDLEFKILLDQDNQVKRLYRITGLPATILIDKNGIMVDRVVGELDDYSRILGLMQRVQSSQSDLQ